MCSLFNQADLGQIEQTLVGSQGTRFQAQPVTYRADVPVVLGVR